MQTFIIICIMSDLVDLIVNSYVNAVQAKLCNRFCKFVYLDLCWLVVGSYLCLCVLHYFPSLVLLCTVAICILLSTKYVDFSFSKVKTIWFSFGILIQRWTTA